MTQTQPHATAAPAVDGPSPTALTGYRRVFDTIFCALTWLFLLGVLVQVLFAGLGTFHGEQGFAPHETLGNILSIVTAVILLVAIVAHVSWATVIAAAVLEILAEVAQHGLAQAGWSHPLLGALHAMDGVIIALIAAALAVTSTRRLRSSAARPV